MIPALGVSPASSRLGWLDALRGAAALAVALHHASYVYLPDLRVRLADRFDPGLFGVLVFFLVSGYIVPASLERRGSVREFWFGRFFRIYPLLAVTCLLAVLPFLLGVLGLRAGLERYSPATAVLAHMTMLQDVLNVPNAMNVLWTLSYEMAFYLLVVALFVVGGHRRSAPAAVVLTVVALVAVALTACGLLTGAYAPAALLSRTAGTGPVVAVTVAALAVAIPAASSRRSAPRVAGGLLGGLLALALVAVNGRVGAWEGLLMLAAMFTGTAVHRAEHGQISRRAAGATGAAVLTGALAAGTWNAAPYGRNAQLVWCGAVLAAAATFAAGWRLRHRRFPAWTTGLGTISFSVYLLHPLLLMAAAQFLGVSGREDAVGLAFFLLVLIAASWASQRWIEAPAQRLGRRLTRPSPPDRRLEQHALAS
ncbi:acyltransferase family protein [Actinomadura mexicana]|uniref:Peptidoglycan/LPS O-acetylase OafA/YrhL, contains acyltransferase and SGNH-hydrolase domains n=1 Tax=Actinomadura mexicana TaxID=134959 RepID=A0A238USR3_9ACTN|nr:acyltransferase [Actinomadura mexicana]SNR24914.1 Peptidoglycan/LPS O-acetylase OafA/YrhL, contains acyltransferase and SGNH-hydrolase domains [Actinomadura mexicana]